MPFSEWMKNETGEGLYRSERILSRIERFARLCGMSIDSVVKRDYSVAAWERC
jgi:hypothetical protein